jgi:putative oxidoreductase
MAIFTVATALFFHKYWSAPDAMKMMQQINFNKNIAIAGGLLALAGFGAGRFSIDKR